MTPEERIAIKAKSVEKSRTRAAQDELRYSLAVARLEAQKAKTAQQRAQLIGGLLIEAAETVPEAASVLATLVAAARGGRGSKPLDGWFVPASVQAPVADVQPAQVSAGSVPFMMRELPLGDRA